MPQVDGIFAGCWFGLLIRLSALVGSVRGQQTWCSIVFALTVLGASEVRAEEKAAPVVVSQVQAAHPGVALARDISQITSLAVSPLLGFTGYNAVTYFKTPLEQRGQLPWFFSPWVWGSCASILLLKILKDTVGYSMPGLKSVLDVAALFESKLSALLVAGTLVPYITRMAASGFSPVTAGDAASQLHFASVPPLGAVGSSLGDAMLPLAWLLFFNVWIGIYALNVLAAADLSNGFDLVSKVAKLGVIAVLQIAPPLIAVALALAVLVAAPFLLFKVGRHAKSFAQRISGKLRRAS
jgi:hypothetical protein